MPLFEYQCESCGSSAEILVTGTSVEPECRNCGSTSMKKQLSAPSSLSGVGKMSMSGPGETACCGVSPQEAGCAGPGSCCGANAMHR